MRNYYQPRLLSQVWGGDPFQQVQPPLELNRVQPKVEIQLEDGPKDDLALVNVEVAKATGHYMQLGSLVQRETKAVISIFLGRTTALENGPIPV